MIAAACPAAGPATLRLPDRFALERGGTLRRGELAYRTLGCSDAPTVVVLGGISGGRDLVASVDGRSAGWWPAIVGDGCAIDTRRLHVVGIDYLGGSGASTGPSASAIESAFPCITSSDQARAISLLLDHLEIPRVRAVVGASYGGMVALAFASRFGGRLERAVVLSAAHRAHPMATALRSLQRQVVRLGLAAGAGREALAVARGIAMTTYRTPAEFALRFDPASAPGTIPPRFPVEDYLAHCGRRFAEVFSPASFLCLSESIDLHRVDPATIATPTTLLAVEGDAVVPPSLMQELRARLAGPAELVTLASIYGHDAFLKEADAVAGLLCRTLFPLEPR